MVYSSSHHFLKCVLSFFKFWYVSKCCRFLKSVLSISKPQLTLQKIETARILLSINLNFGCSSHDNLPSVNNYGVHHVFPQKRKLMGSSAQNSSGVHWCRRRVRFNEVPEKVPKVPEKVWEALVQSRVKFNRVLEKVLEKVWEALVESQVSWLVSTGSGEGVGRFRRRSGRLWCRARSSSTGSADV